jgi:hypothetical protein
MSLVRSQLSVARCQRLVAGGRSWCLVVPWHLPLTTDRGQLTTDHGQRATDHGQLTTDDGQLTTDSGSFVLQFHYAF